MKCKRMTTYVVGIGVGVDPAIPRDALLTLGRGALEEAVGVHLEVEGGGCCEGEG